jgi:hypothetical protein
MIQYAKANPDLPFVMGLGWRYDYLGGKLPNKKMLDDFGIKRPTILWSYGGQSGWLNTAALKHMEKENPEALERLGPQVDKQTGKRTGLLLHFHAFNPFEFFSFEKMALQKMKDCIRATLDEAVSMGVTTMNDVQVYKSFISMISEIKKEGILYNSRVRCSYYVDPHMLEDEEAFKKEMNWWKKTGENSDSRLVLGDSVKFYIDGVTGNYTAFMLEPYPPFTGMPKNYYGDPVWSAKLFNRVMEIIDGMGLQACTHSCGDAGIRRVIEAYQHAAEVNGTRDARHRLEHCGIPRPRDVVKMGQLGMCAAMQPAHFFAADEFTEKLLGPERINYLMPWRSMEKEGVLLSFGSDWCNSPLNPIYGLILAATRMNAKGKTNWGPGEKITTENVIKHWTIDSARALLMEKELGSIEVGKLADFVLFNYNPLKMACWWFLLTHKIELGALDYFVDMTVVGGKIVYEKKGKKEQVRTNITMGKLY